MPSREEELNAENDAWHAVNKQMRQRIAELERHMAEIYAEVTKAWNGQQSRDQALRHIATISENP